MCTIGVGDFIYFFFILFIYFFLGGGGKRLMSHIIVGECSGRLVHDVDMRYW